MPRLDNIVSRAFSIMVFACAIVLAITQAPAATAILYDPATITIPDGQLLTIRHYMPSNYEVGRQEGSFTTSDGRAASGFLNAEFDSSEYPPSAYAFVGPGTLGFVTNVVITYDLRPTTNTFTVITRSDAPSIITVPAGK